MDSTAKLLNPNPMDFEGKAIIVTGGGKGICLLYTSPSPRDAHESRMPSSA